MYRLRAFLAAFLSWNLFNAFWQCLELSVYGELRPNNVDSVISIIVFVLFYVLYRNVLEKRAMREQLDKNITVNIQVNDVDSQNEAR